MEGVETEATVVEEVTIDRGQEEVQHEEGLYPATPMETGPASIHDISQTQRTSSSSSSSRHDAKLLSARPQRRWELRCQAS